jgi:hypothetical protein
MSLDPGVRKVIGWTKDLTLSAEEHCHPLTPHLVVLPIEV